MVYTKAELRSRLKQARLELTDAEHTVKSRQIVERLKQAADWSQVKTLHYFEPISELLEPDISGFLTFIEDNFADIKLFTPRKIGGEWDLVAAKGGEVPKEFDAVIVPMLGFDPQTLHRIGYGGGYYDEFLSTQPHAQKIGVCFELGETANLPTEPHDIPLDKIITESDPS
ncbi:MAG TPA: 5-formyltetrahydrofolate cyclo-ligase [Candidatus Saccharimonadia bacterium]|nr:5-formyltetrahydrofolate cyclo-ligase [Candidatus Saccharimonadia bacterium]